MANKTVIVYGGSGALGRACVSEFKTKGFRVFSVDLQGNDEADNNVIVEPSESWVAQEEQVSSAMESALSGTKVNGIFCVAGGWAGGNAANKDMIKNADMMWKQSVWTSSIAAKLAASHLDASGTLVLTGASPALKGTPGMMGYGMAKAAVQQLTKSLAGKNSGLPADSFVAAILPVTLDTPMNRKFMPKGDFTTWTPLQTVADKFLQWTSGEERPASGSLVEVVTKDSTTDFKAV